MNNPEILILGTADWNQPIATNQHYMTRELSKSYSTTFVESLGLRRPELTLRDIRRVYRRFKKSPKNSSDRDVPTNVQVASPMVIPIHTQPFYYINRRLLQRGNVKRWATAASPRIFWTYSPVTYGLEQAADVAYYHCVDLLGEFPGIDRSLVDINERRLARAGVKAIASSKVVLSHLRKQGFRDPIYWPNVADAENIARAAADMPEQRNPSVIFAGNLTSKKVDFLLLQELLESGIMLHLAGPVAQGGGDAEKLLADLVNRGATYHGMLSLEALAKVMATCSVGLIPYELNAYTRGVSPLKVYEYLAAGLSVVSTPIPSVEHHQGHVMVEPTRAGFIQAVQALLTPVHEGVLAERSRLAEQHSWSGRGKQARALLAESLAH